MNGPLSINMDDPRRKNVIMPLGAGGEMVPATAMVGPDDEEKARMALGQEVGGALLTKGPLQDAAKGLFTSPAPAAAPLAAMNPGDADQALANATAAGGGVAGDVASGISPLGAAATLVSTGSVGKAGAQLAGQALGQAMIPIPGVGAVLGGAVGKYLGGALGFNDGTPSVPPAANSLSDEAIAQALAQRRAQQQAALVAAEQPSIFQRILAMVMGNEGMLGNAKKNITGRQRQLDEAEKKAMGYADGTTNVANGKSTAGGLASLFSPPSAPSAQSPVANTNPGGTALNENNPVGGKNPADNPFGMAGQANPAQAAQTVAPSQGQMKIAPTAPMANPAVRQAPAMFGAGGTRPLATRGSGFY
jgi:hypothetical protein